MLGRPPRLQIILRPPDPITAFALGTTAAQALLWLAFSGSVPPLAVCALTAKLSWLHQFASMRLLAGALQCLPMARADAISPRWNGLEADDEAPLRIMQDVTGR